MSCFLFLFCLGISLCIIFFLKIILSLSWCITMYCDLQTFFFFLSFFSLLYYYTLSSVFFSLLALSCNIIMNLYHYTLSSLLFFIFFFSFYLYLLILLSTFFHSMFLHNNLNPTQILQTNLQVWHNTTFFLATASL